LVNRLLILGLVFGLVAVGCSRPATPKDIPVPQTSATPAQPTTPPITPPTTAPIPQPTVPSPPVPPPDQHVGPASSLQEFIPFRDATVVRAAIAQPSVVTYRVVNVGETEGPDLSNYVDDLMSKSNWPAQNDLVLVVFAAHNHDIRFGMGNLFWQKGVTVEEILDLVRLHYLPEARKGQPEVGLVDLIGAVNRLMN